MWLYVKYRNSRNHAPRQLIHWFSSIEGMGTVIMDVMCKFLVLPVRETTSCSQYRTVVVGLDWLVAETHSKMCAWKM
jgi:hypothetical protein